MKGYTTSRRNKMRKTKTIYKLCSTSYIIHKTVEIVDLSRIDGGRTVPVEMNLNRKSLPGTLLT